MKKACYYLKKIWTDKMDGYLCTPNRKKRLSAEGGTTLKVTYLGA